MLIADGDVRMHGDAVCAAVEEQHVPPCVQGALDIAGRGIADVPCLGRVEPQRLLDMKAAQEIYRTMGKVFGQGFPHRYYIISPDMEFERSFGRKADKRRKLYNGMIPCQLYMYFKG